MTQLVQMVQVGCDSEELLVQKSTPDTIRDGAEQGAHGMISLVARAWVSLAHLSPLNHCDCHLGLSSLLLHSFPLIFCLLLVAEWKEGCE